MLIEGKTKELPIVITLHGGPGTPIPFCVGGRGLFPALSEKCILVSWDQYGCGINNAELPDHFTIENFVEMTRDLIVSLKQEFKSNKIYLFAMSWGSVLSAKAAYEFPYLIDGVIVYGQVLRNLMHTDDVIEALMESSASPKSKEEMTIVLKKEFPTNKEIMSISKWIRKYTQGYQNKNTAKAPFGNIMKGIMVSPDYTLKDFIAILKNGYAKNNSIMNELSKIDLSNTLTKVSVPYHIVQGDTDIVTSTEEISKFVNKCNNQYLSISIVENSAHIPSEKGMNTIMNMVCNFNEWLPTFG